MGIIVSIVLRHYKPCKNFISMYVLYVKFMIHGCEISGKV
jgi:hypothetical protein